VFDQSNFEESLRALGCVESFVSPIISDYRLLMPLVLRELGADRVVHIANGSREELGLNEQTDLCRTSARYIVSRATAQLEAYKAR
jgi:hypothetical protein